jgi:hypothetical protein
MPSTAATIVSYAGSALGWIGANAGAISTVGQIAQIGLSAYRAQNAELDRGDFASSFESQASQLSEQIKQPITSRRVTYGRTRLAGAITALETQNDNTDLHFFSTLCEGPIQSFERFYVDGERVLLNDEGWVRSGKYKNLIRIRAHRGTKNQTPDGKAMQEMDTVGPNFKGKGVAYVYVKAKFDREVFNSIPEIQAEIKGRNTIWDPRVSEDNADERIGYTNNPALCVANYLMDNKVGLQEDRDSIDTERLKTAANICDEQVELKDGSFQRRYRCNGVLNTSNKVKKNLSNLLSSMVGKVVWSNGSWNIFAGGYTAPSISFDEDDRIGSMSVQGQAPADQRYNGVKGVFRSKNEGYQPTDFPSVSRDKWLADDDGVRRWKDIDLPFTSDPVRAQRIGLVHLERSRRMVSTTWPMKMTALKALTGETVELSDKELGWDKKPFRTESMSVMPGGSEGEDGEAGLGFELSLTETESGIYDWIKDEEKDTSSGTPPSAKAENPSAPSNVTLSSGTDQVIRQSDGELLSIIKIEWGEPKTRRVRGSVQATKSTIQGSMAALPDDLVILRGNVQAGDAKVFGIESGRRIVGSIESQDSTVSGSITPVYATSSISGSVQAVYATARGIKTKIHGIASSQDATTTGSISHSYTTASITGTVQPINADVQGIEERNLVSVAGSYHIQWREKQKFENSRVWPNEKRVDGKSREALTSAVKANQVYQVRIRKVLDSGFSSPWVQKEITAANIPPSSKTAVDADDIIIAGDDSTDKQTSTAGEIANVAEKFLYTESGSVNLSDTNDSQTVSLSRDYTVGIASVQNKIFPTDSSDNEFTATVEFDASSDEVIIRGGINVSSWSASVDWAFFGWSNDTS